MIQRSPLVASTIFTLIIPWIGFAAEEITALNMGTNVSQGSTSVTSRFRLPFESEKMPSLWQWGRLKASPSIDYRVFHASGLADRNGVKEGSTVQELSPSVSVTLGGRWSGSYSPSWTWYSNPSMRDNVSHSFQFGGGTQIDLWNFSLSQTYTLSDEARFETGTQTKEETWSTEIGFSRPVNKFLSFQSNFTQQLRFSPSFTDTKEWSSMSNLMFRVLPSVSAGPGLGFGYIDTDPGVNSKFVQSNISVSWTPLGKLSISGNMGLDWRKSEQVGLPWTSSTTHSVNALYRITSVTTIAASTSRSLGSSYFANQGTTSDQWQLSLSQRILKRFSLSSSYSEGKVKYTGLASSVNRSDKVNSWNFSLSADLLPRLSSSIFYRISKNDTPIAAFAARSEQYGLSLGYSF